MKTAIRLEIAVLEWELYDKKYGILGQYLNLLSREGCLVSRELDFKKTSKTYYNNDQKYIDNIINAIRNDLNYHGELKNKSKSGLYTTFNRITTGQRILAGEPDSTATKTKEILLSIFNKYNFEFESKKVELTRSNCISIYDSLVFKVYSSNIKVEPELEKLIKKGINVTDHSKIRRVTSILKLLFEVENPKKEGLMVTRNRDLLKSIKKSETGKQ